MAYTKINWKNFPDVSTPINADNLNHMDSGISDSSNNLYGGFQYWNPVLGSVKSPDVSSPTAPVYTNTSSDYFRGIYKFLGDMIYISFSIKTTITNKGSGLAVIKGLPAEYSIVGRSELPNAGLAVNQCLGAINTEYGSSTQSTEQTPASFIIWPNQTQIAIQSGSGTSQRQWMNGTVWIGASGFYPTHPKTLDTK